MAMGIPLFDYAHCGQEIEAFLSEMPDRLRENSATEGLAAQVAALSEASEGLFTVAIVGQMKIGKSSLVNALMDGPDLAVTGVNETTATINWFKYGRGHETERFRVVWRDQPEEELPLSELKRWLGDSEYATRTQSLEFFADSQFLMTANIVDTPGTRSVVEGHSEAANGVLAGRHEKATQRLGRNADAIVYVLPQELRGEDEKQLKNFRDNTRLPSSGPYNSVAVLHKWETIQQAADPKVIAERAERHAAEFENLVSTVLPVSAPLALSTARVPDSSWCELVKLAQDTPHEDREDLLLSQEEVEDSPAWNNCWLAFDLPWPCFKLILATIWTHGDLESLDGGTLKALIRNRSGIDALVDLLQKRFFGRSKIIKMSTALGRAWSLCDQARRRLEPKVRKLREDYQDSEKVVAHLKSRVDSGDETLAHALGYVVRSRQAVWDQIDQCRRLADLIGNKSLEVKDLVESVQADREALDLLEIHGHRLPRTVVEEVRSILGWNGSKASQRLSYLQPEHPGTLLPSFQGVEESLGEVIKLENQVGGKLRTAIMHARDRLEELLDWLEGKGDARDSS